MVFLCEFSAEKNDRDLVAGGGGIVLCVQLQTTDTLCCKKCLHLYLVFFSHCVLLFWHCQLTVGVHLGLHVTSVCVCWVGSSL